MMIHASIEVLKPGDILVVTTTSESTDGMFGELLAESARAHGAVGGALEDERLPVAREDGLLRHGEADDVVATFRDRHSAPNLEPASPNACACRFSNNCHRSRSDFSRCSGRAR